MIINPIIPIWIMVVICAGFLFLKRKGKINYIRQILIVVLLFVINLRIMIPGEGIPTVAANVDVLFVIDNTISMLAEDYNGDGIRMDAVKKDCRYIMEQFPGASFSVTTFGDGVKTLTPYTIDSQMITETIGLLNGQTELYATGTSLNEVMEEMEEILNDGRKNCKIVFFISDGEIMNSDDLKSYPGLKKYVDTGAVLGYGTTKGGKMKALQYLSDEEEPEYLEYYDENYDKQLAVSKIDEDNLKKIASDLGVSYIHMTKQSQIDKYIDKMKSKAEKFVVNEDMKPENGYRDIYFWFLIPLIILLVWDYIYYKRKI